MQRHKYRLIVPFVLPSLLLYCVFVLYPYLRAMTVSFFLWRGLSPSMTFVGLHNYEKMLGDDKFWNALSHNAVYLVMLPVCVLGLALAFAFLITQGVRGGNVYRVAFYFPQVISLVAVGVLWSFVYHPTLGILNGLLRLVGLSQLARAWLGDPQVALPAVGAVIVWHVVGFYMVLFIAAMQSIPETYYEAARVDGASRWHLFRHITLPLLASTTQVALIFLAISAVDMFTIVQTMTEGGPNRATEVLAVYLYSAAFLNSEFGYGTAIAVAMFLITLVLSLILMRTTQRERLEY